MTLMIAKGQRWMSDTEPELGLGVVVLVEKRYLDIFFPTKNITRRYSREDPPLRRIIFKPGDTLHDSGGKALKVTLVEGNPENILTYRCGTAGVSETDLSDVMSASTPLTRLSRGRVDTSEHFDLRARLLDFHTEMLKSTVRGYAGARIDLLPHQLFIAHTVTRAGTARALLADETGLGKTIEASLILSRLLALGRVSRVLILVPGHLVHQWFVELRRRFNLNFCLFSGEYLSGFAEEENPFLSAQLGICNMELLAAEGSFREQAVAAPWDMLIVDEAHHLKQNSPPYDLVRRLSEKTEGLLLLTATPEQLGQEDHFARLHLLDPFRYASFEDYSRETRKFQELFDFIQRALAEKQLDLKTLVPSRVLLEVPESFFGEDQDPLKGRQNPPTVKLSLDKILDYFGTGRIIFRNTRRNIPDFPKRILHLAPLAGDESSFEKCRHEFLSDAGEEPSLVKIDKTDPRTEWISGLIRDVNPEKILILCSTKEKVLSLEKALQHRGKTDIAVFHEEMTILQRDRNAAWFAEEDGARILISSEIGSEGRNFQFCHHLVLFDLPLNPELLEQRIGRLDRIGQKETIHLHIPFLTSTIQEVLCRWYHEGLDCFCRNVPAAGRVYELLRDKILEMGRREPIPSEEIAGLLQQTREKQEQLSVNQLNAREKLFELNSFEPLKSREIIDTILALDTDQKTRDILHSLLRHYGIETDDAGYKKTALITAYVTDPDFPLPRSERPVITFDRQTALHREDIEFITLDHPMLKDALDLFLSSEQGTCACAFLPDESGEEELLLELIFIVECVAPPHLNTDRFLPPTTQRIVMDEDLSDVTDDFLPERLTGLRDTKISELFSGYDDLSGLLDRMTEAATKIAEIKKEDVIAQALAGVKAEYEKEKHRLDFLQRSPFGNIQDQLLLCETQRESLEKHLRASRIRLDSMKVIQKGEMP